MTDQDVSTKVLDHLGIIAGVVGEMGLVEKINQRLSETRQVSMGDRVKAMILNGLGFMDDRLYMFERFLDNKPVERLFSSDVKASHFNDDALGRCLDRIAEYGGTKLFSELAFEIGMENGLLGKTAHIDSTSLSLYGEYAGIERDNDAVRPKQGYAKNHRFDLQQMVLNLATTGASGLPVCMEAHSGNAADQVILMNAAQRMKTFCQSLGNAPAFMVVADSAIYDACLSSRDGMKWLTRAPERHKFIRKMTEQTDSDIAWQDLSNGYRYAASQATYKGVSQRFILVHSDQAYQRESKTLEKRLKKMEQEKKGELWHLRKQVFGCDQDAQKAIKSFQKSLKILSADLTVLPILGHKKSGRPAKNTPKSIEGFRVSGTIAVDTAAVEKKKTGMGRFVLATNELDPAVLPNDHILATYKEQSSVEGGFKLIKDHQFEVGSVFLKKPSRISALMVIMTLCLMVYALAQHHIRKTLANHDDAIPNQLKKTTNTPTMKWVCRLFHGVHVVSLSSNGITSQIVANLDDKIPS